MRRPNNRTVFIVCTTDSMITSFLIPYIERFVASGYKVRCFCSRTGDYFDRLLKRGVDVTEIPFTRNPASVSNIKAGRALAAAMRADSPVLVFCHEPVGGAIGRICAKLCHAKTIYMVHGFHFYRGAPVANWLLYYPIELALSFITDAIITINQEDYEFAKRHIRSKRVAFMHGVGVDTTRFCKRSSARTTTRKELGLGDNDIAILSVGELNTNKNHIAILLAMKQLRDDKLHCFIAGVGDQRQRLVETARRYGLDAHLHLLGYRNDCDRLYAAADIFCLPSYREGLSVALIEAMACGLPAVASHIRGNRDLVDRDGGFLFNVDDAPELAKALAQLVHSKTLRRCMGQYNAEKASRFSIDTALDEFEEIANATMTSASTTLQTR